MIPKKFWSSLFFLISFVSSVLAQLPPYTGEYGVGIVDVEVPVADPRNITNTTLNSSGRPALQLETVLFTLYYPISNSTESSVQQHYWLPRPIEPIAEGLTGVTGGSVDPSLISTGLQALAANLTIPAEADAPLLPADQKESFPVLVFSHGDSSLGTWYSVFSGEMASRGYVVAALQHRDGSAPATTVNDTATGQLRNLTATTAEMVSPAMNATEFAVAQLQMRQAEVEAAVEVLSSINQGDGEQVYQDNSRGEGSSLDDWEGRLDLEHLVISGHSLGATLALQLTAPTADAPIRAALLFDPGKSSGPLNANITVPVAVLESEAYAATPAPLYRRLYGRDYFDVVRGAVQDSLDDTGAGWFMTQLGTTHVSISDAPLVTTAFISFFDNYTSNYTVSPAEAMAQYVRVAHDFMLDFVDGTRERVLAQEAEYPDFRPGLSNATVESSPWEVHVAPDGDGGSGGGGGASGESDDEDEDESPTGAASCLRFGGALETSLWGAVLAVAVFVWL